MWVIVFIIGFVISVTFLTFTTVGGSKLWPLYLAIGLVGIGLCVAAIKFDTEARQRNLDDLTAQLSNVEDLGVVDIRELQSKGVYTDPTGRIYMWQEGTLLVGDKKTQ